MKYGKVKEWQPIRGNGASFKVEINNKTNTRGKITNCLSSN